MSSIANTLRRFINLNRTATKRKSPLTQRSMAAESLEQRQVLSVTNPWFSGSMLVVPTDNASTTVALQSSGTNVLVKDTSSNRSWTYASGSVTKVEFQGGSGNDRFINYIYSMPIRAYGGAGNDYIEGYNGADVMVGGSGNDTLNGYGGNDQMWGGSGNDVLLGGYGNDDLVGEEGNDQLNGQADLDRMWGGNGDDVLIAIDNGTSDYVQSDTGYDAIWVDANGSATDGMVGNSSLDKVQQISRFANGADRTLNGDRIADPNGRIVDDKGNVYGAAVKSFANIPLFTASGPSATDVFQGACGDCYFLAGAGAIAQDSPKTLRQNLVDFNDGTYGVRMGNSFFRVDNDLPVNSTSSTSPAYAKLGQSGNQSMWVAVAEKAFAHYRTGASSYSSIQGGWSVEVNRAFGTSSAGDRGFDWFGSAASMANEIYNRWINRESVTVGFSADGQKAASNTTPLILGHMYTVTRVIRNTLGVVTGIELRNPWGYDGGTITSGNASDGLVLVTPDQLWGFRTIGRINWGRV